METNRSLQIHLNLNFPNSSSNLAHFRLFHRHDLQVCNLYFYSYLSSTFTVNFLHQQNKIVSSGSESVFKNKRWCTIQLSNMIGLHTHPAQKKRQKLWAIRPVNQFRLNIEYIRRILVWQSFCFTYNILAFPERSLCDSNVNSLKRRAFVS